MSSTNTVMYTPWLDAMRQIAVHHGLSVSQENLTRMMAWERGVALESAMVRIARRLGLEGRVLQDVPCERINQALLPDREFLVGETIGNLVKRECPAIFSIPERAGFVLSFDLPENTSDALAQGILAYSIKRPRSN